MFPCSEMRTVSYGRSLRCARLKLAFPKRLRDGPSLRMDGPSSTTGMISRIACDRLSHEIRLEAGKIRSLGLRGELSRKMVEQPSGRLRVLNVLINYSPLSCSTLFNSAHAVQIRVPIVLCVDEKSQIQALQRTQPGLPLKKGRCGTMTHDYKRHGTTTCFSPSRFSPEKVIRRSGPPASQGHPHFQRPRPPLAEGASIAFPLAPAGAGAQPSA
jgi:hypothetical protein